MPATEPTPDVWNDSLLQNPHQVADKRSRVQKMFAAIAPSYDLNNRLHSLWMDQRWRRRAVKLAALKWHDHIVDVACGTGDLTLAFANRITEIYPNPYEYQDLADGQICGVDFTFPMLPIARAKAVKSRLAAINWVVSSSLFSPPPTPTKCCPAS